MPRRMNTRVKSLQEVCIDNVVNNIDKWCYQYVEKYGANKLDHLDVDGPFDSLPSTFLEQIFEILWRKNLLKREHLELLVTPQLKTLNFMHCRFDDKDIAGISQFLHLTSIRCSQLTVLRWQSWPGYPREPSTFRMFLPMFQKLQELHISNTETGDSCLQVLGAYCRELRILNAEDCSEVTDVGIKGLCAAIFDETGREIQTLGQCKSIHTLNIKKTKVTKKGIRLALENLPALRIFEFDSPVQILAELHKECNFPNYQLVSLLSADDYEESPCRPYKNGSLGRVASLCSSLNKVHIVTIPGWTDQELLGLLHLNSLCELAISGETNLSGCAITFDGGIVPLLKAFGNSLTLFSLDKVYGLRVNIRAIVEYCPKLEFLSLEDSGDYVTAPLDEDEQPPSKRRKKVLILENLKVLKISCDSEREFDISPEGLDMLLSSPSLVKLNIDVCRTVDYCILRRAFDLHQFRHLQSLGFLICRDLSEQSIYLFMNENNPLKKIEIDSCELLTEEFAKELVDFVRQKSWDVKISFL